MHRRIAIACHKNVLPYYTIHCGQLLWVLGWLCLSMCVYGALVYIISFGN